MFPLVVRRDDPAGPVHRLLRPRLLRPAPGRRLLPRHRRHRVRGRASRSSTPGSRRSGAAWRSASSAPGMGGTAISALTTVKLFDHLGEQAPFLITAAVLASTPSSPGWCCATPPAASSPPTRLVAGSSANARLPITWQACILYAVAFGGYVAFSVYLPAYLKTAYGLTPADAANRMAGFVVVAVIMRPVGGWLSDRFGPVPVLVGRVRRGRRRRRDRGRAPARRHPRHGRVPRPWPRRSAPASGATFALVAQVTEPARVGGVTGLVGAAGGLGGFVPPLLMGYVYGRTDSYAIGLCAARGHRRAARCCSPSDRRPTHRRREDRIDPSTGSTRHRAGRHPLEDAPGPAAGGSSPRAPCRTTFAPCTQVGRPRGRRLLPRPVEPRQGRALHPRRELHRLVLVEGLRQGRDHHLGDPADRLPLGRARTARSTSPAAARAAPRSPGTPTRPPGCATPTSAACCCRCTARPSSSTTATR